MARAVRKLRVLHSAALLSPPSGILAQMDWEQDAANTLGLDWEVRMYCPLNNQIKSNILQCDNTIHVQHLQSPIGKLLAWIKLRRNYHRWLLQQQDSVDIFLLRYYVHDPFQLAFVRRCKKPVFFVHHTLEVPELALPGGVSGFVRSNLETLLGRPTIAKATGVIGVTKEIVDYELVRACTPNKSAYVYPNGIVFQELQLEDRRSADVPEFLFVANFAPWHGLDILLNNIAQSKENFILHLVGKIPSQLLALTRDPRIRVHGHLNQQQIQKLSAQCWIGLASFALFRKKMKQACPLKVREYLMLGLPVYGDYQDAFDYDVPFFKTGGDDLELISNYAIRTRGLSKDATSSMAKDYIEKSALLKKLYFEVLLDSNQNFTSA
jgi:glycosyltransferase involved in cell wall biosynthesis